MAGLADFCQEILNIFQHFLGHFSLAQQAYSIAANVSMLYTSQDYYKQDPNSL
jgi:hypothetical protein